MSTKKNEAEAPAAAAPAPQPKDNSVKIVLIVLLCVFGIPIIMAIVALIFVSVHFDDIKDIVNHAIDRAAPYYVEGVRLDSDRIRTVNTVTAAAIDTRVREVGISRKDCENLRIMSNLNGVEGAGDPILPFSCDNTSVRIKTVDFDTDIDAKEPCYNSIVVAWDNSCARFDFGKGNTRLLKYKYYANGNDICRDAVDVNIIDTGEKAAPMSIDNQSKKSDDIVITIED